MQTRIRFLEQLLLDRHDEDTIKTLVATLTNEEATDQPLEDPPIGGSELVTLAVGNTLIARVPLEGDVKLLVLLDASTDVTLNELRDSCRQISATALDSRTQSPSLAPRRSSVRATAMRFPRGRRRRLSGWLSMRRRW